MHFLSLETSTKIFSLAVSKDEEVLRFRNLKSAQVLEDSIIDAIDKILDSAGVAFQKIDGFAVALGPGSFTSLRVGLSTVKAFAMATQKPVVGISSLDVIAEGVAHIACDEICVITDARRGNVYSAIYRQGKRQGEHALTTLDDVLDRVHGKTLFVGDAINLYKTAIEAAGCVSIFADEKFWYPQAKNLAKLAYQRFEAKKHDEASTLVPIYLYPQDCQVQKS